MKLGRASESLAGTAATRTGLRPSRAAITAVRLSWERLARSLVLPYLIAIATLVAATAIGVLRWSNSLYFHEDLKFASGTGQGALTFVNSLMLGAAGILFLVVAYQLAILSEQRARPASAVLDRSTLDLRRRLSLPWVAFAGVALLLATDEVLMGHEYISYRLDSGRVPKLLGYIDQDFFVFSIYGLLVAMVLALTWPTIVEFGSGILPLCAFGLFMVLSQLVDFVPWSELTRAQQQILGPTEESLKSLGGFSLLIYALVLSHDVIQRRVEASVQARPEGGEVPSTSER